MKKIPLRIRITLVASLFLLVSCVSLTLLSNASAGRMMQAAELLPAMDAHSMAELTPAVPPNAMEHEVYYRNFQKETVIATCVIVLLGSAATYLAAGYVLKPIRVLSDEVKGRNANNLDRQVSIPQSADEVRELAVSFNRMMAELQRSFELQRQFSANAAHELRTPLAVMQAKLDVFLMEKGHGADAEKLVGELNGQLERLSGLIEDLLWFSKDLPLEEKGKVELYPLLCDVADELEPLADERQIRLNIEKADCSVQGQDRLLERVFYNLMENAIKYSPPGAKVTISARKEPGCVRVEVSDQGEGIPEEYREAIFEPFFRVDKSRSRAIGGSGLGLAVCKKILERHGASVCVLPNSPRGSVFSLTFPA